jgi:hypothetical protein
MDPSRLTAIETFGASWYVPRLPSKIFGSTRTHGGSFGGSQSQQSGLLSCVNVEVELG